MGGIPTDAAGGKYVIDAKPTLPKGNTLNPKPVKFKSAEPMLGGQSLRIVWESGVEPCHTLDRVEVKETAKSVTVTLFEGQDQAQQNVACVEMAVTKQTTVELKDMLEGRKVVDGAK
ncbi:hypothetical protein [Bailinhaonella thermotolerans]|uniref:Uncharacterized protein n=1 Tax=Bailinhaonella thermotolerans TaxID=1070861 RepID=A0A3A4AC71_9ACTN|nr:hypothetical protein [Bailinhaonella thermotolerans]RJL24124.1 hypothetical protein D5H75_30180 [Bailinhaonella thermotolerans]